MTRIIKPFAATLVELKQNIVFLEWISTWKYHS